MATYPTAPLPQQLSAQGLEPNTVDSDEDELPFATKVYNWQHPTIENEEQEQIEPDPIAIVNRAHRQRELIVETLFHVDLLPEYPTTSPNGVAYVITLQGMSNAEVENLKTDFQYGKKRSTASVQIPCAYLDNALMTRWKWTCSGIKACQYLHPELNIETVAVDDGLFDLIRRFRGSIDLAEERISRRNANSVYLGYLKAFRDRVACKGWMDSCQLSHGFFQENVSGVRHAYATCVNSNPTNNKDHFFDSLQSHHQTDHQYLLELLQNSIHVSINENCGQIEQVSTRRGNCGIDHPQGPGQWRMIGCDVEFYLFLPNNRLETEYAVFVSVGTHKHAPPPPNKPPQTLLQPVLRLIERMEDPRLTLVSFLKNRALAEFCTIHQKKHISEIHNSFANMDRFRALIKKYRLLYYPMGRDFAGVRFEYETKHVGKPDQYIQDIWCEDSNWFIICFLPKALQILCERTTLEMDTSYKRIKDTDVMELVFAGFLENHGKIVTLARIYLNHDTKVGYARVFQRFFTLIEQKRQKPNQWATIHNQGWNAVSVDQDTKQYAGLGVYLNSIDPQSRSGTWHLERLLIFCRVHFKRGILRALPRGYNDFSTFSDYGRMMALLDSQSEEEYNELLQLIQENTENPVIFEWAKHKKAPLVRAAICKGCTKMDLEVFMEVRENTNTVEQTHNKSYAWGKGVSILEGVLDGRSVDYRDILQIKARDKYNTSHGYRNTSGSARFYTNLMREQTRRNRKIERAQSRRSGSQSPSVFDEFEDILDTDSTGAPSFRSRSRSRSNTPHRAPNRSSSPALRRVASRNLQQTNNMTQQQAISLREREIEIQRATAEVRAAQLANEKLELDLLERRRRLGI